MQQLYYKLLLLRLPTNHPQITNVQDSLTRIEAGYYGELRLLRELNDMPDSIFGFKNFQCYSLQNFSHQLDFLLLTTRCAIILEVKNISGLLSYQAMHHEFHRIKTDGQVDIFRNPFDQAYRHQLMLEQYFSSWQVDLPVYYAAVMTNTNTRLDPSFGHLPIFHVSYLRRFLRELQAQLPEKNMNFKDLQMHLQNIATILPPRRMVDASALQYGILCEQCTAIMHYRGGLCSCTKCGFKTRNGVRTAMRDYQVLIGPQITNQEFRKFTGISDVQTASKILSRLGYKKYGKNRGTYYEISELENVLSNFELVLSNNS